MKNKLARSSEESPDKQGDKTISRSVRNLIQFDNDGGYRCAACGEQLFKAGVTFDTETGWPNFDEALPEAVRFIEDTKCSMECVEVTCAGCTAHLGHMFLEGVTETGKRYCMNAVCLEIKIEQ